MSERFFEIVRDEFRKHPKTNITLPRRATENSIAYDIFSPVDVVLKPFKPTLIMTDIKAKFSRDEALLINVRSSMGKVPIILANNQGWIESDYYSNESNDGNLGVMLLNLSKSDYSIKVGDRIAQAMFINYLESDNGNTYTKRNGGFGSTGK